MKRKKWTWRTYKGETVTLDSIEHQHISNLYWHNLIISNRDLLQEDAFIETIEHRFSGEILPYRPPIDFAYEVHFLKKNGHLKRDKEDPTKINVVFNGEIVGYII